MRAKSHITYTYDKVTPESAAEGDIADYGYYIPGGWDVSLNGDDRGEVIAKAQAGEYDYPCEKGWIKDVWDTAGPFTDVSADGETVTAYGYPSEDWPVTIIAVHITCPTEASAHRVARALKKG